jgi:hypothetical protein
MRHKGPEMLGNEFVDHFQRIVGVHVNHVP